MYEYRTDDGEIVELTYCDFMLSDDAGFITLDDGRVAKRVNRGDSWRSKSKGPNGTPKIVSDALGFTVSQLREMEEDRVKSRIRGIEFRPDPDVPEFYQVHCDSEQAKSRYMKHRGFSDKNSKNGSSCVISELEFKKLKERFS